MIKKFRLKKLIVFLFTIFTASSLCSQNALLFQPSELNSVIEYEKTIQSDNKGFYNLNPYFDEDIEDLIESWPKLSSQALIFKRSIDDFYPPQHAYYFFDKDSVVKLIYYKWSFANPTIEVSDEELRKQTSRTNEYLTKYYDEKKKLNDILGDETQKEVIVDNTSYFSRKTIWDFMDKRVVLKMVADKVITEVDHESLNKPALIPRSKIQITILLKE